eukprot:m.240849 g.240849  ORF g.240849 m.240849 type:complete len:324 (+) comp15316_c2_seq1:102-1073(+)
MSEHSFATARIQNVFSKLSKSRYLTAKDEDVLAGEIRRLESSLGLQKRRMHYREGAVERSKEEREALEMRLSLLQTRIEQISSEIAHKEQIIGRLQGDLDKSRHAIAQLDGEKQQVLDDNARLLDEREVFAQTSSFACSKASSSQTDPTAFMVAAVNQATSCVKVMVHSFTNLLLAEALAKAAQRGVAVYVLYDGSWADAAAAAGGASEVHSVLTRIFKRWRSAGVRHATQHGKKLSSHPTVRYHPFNHNSMCIDDKVLITGRLEFADVRAGEESTLVVVASPTGQPIKSVVDTVLLFDHLWQKRTKHANLSREVTTIRLPKL